MKKFIIFLVLIIVAVAVYLVLSETRPVLKDAKVPKTEKMESNFSKPKKSAHYENNTPPHGEILAGVPVNVSLDFNFDLAKPSDISIMKNGMEYGVGETVIDNNKLAMRKNMDSQAPDGFYEVFYKACWPDGSCHDGKFQFGIDRGKKSEYTDMRGKKELALEMVDFSFSLKKVLIDKGTKITWVNKDGAIHYVNTDPHPQHTHYPMQNSQAMNKNDKYTLTFDKSGWYPYHCSAHARIMTAQILVE